MGQPHHLAAGGHQACVLCYHSLCIVCPTCVPWSDFRLVTICFTPSGVPPLVRERPLGTEKMRARCASGGSVRAARHGVAPMEDGTGTWQGLVAKEQYCSTHEYYSGRHAHCRASIEAYYLDDLRLLYGGTAGGSG